MNLHSGKQYERKQMISEIIVLIILIIVTQNSILPFETITVGTHFLPTYSIFNSIL